MIQYLKRIFLIGVITAPIFIITGATISSSIEKATIKVNQYTFNSPITAEVESVNVRVGERVVKNQLILMLNAEDLQQQSSALRSSIQLMNYNYLAEVKMLKSSLQVAKTSLNFQQQELSRYRSYQASGAVSMIMLSTQMQNYEAARALVDSYSQKLVLASTSHQQNLFIAQEKLNKLQSQIKSTVIYAKESGIISQLNVTHGQIVVVGSNLVSIDQGYRIVVNSDSKINSQITMLVGRRYVKCNVINISNHEKSSNILSSVDEKTIYNLDCQKIQQSAIIDNKKYFIW